MSDISPFSLVPPVASDVSFIYKLRQLTMRPFFESSVGWDEVQQRTSAAEYLNDTRIILSKDERVGVVKVLHREDKIILHQLQILPAFQGKGIGGMILRGIIRDARVKKVPVELLVFKESPAFALYLRLGFRIVGDYQYHVEMSLTPRSC